MSRSLFQVRKWTLCLLGALAFITTLVSSSSSLPPSTTTTTYLHERGTHVVQLTDENFEHLTQAATGQTTGKWFINFSQMQCGHCAKLAPQWSRLAEELITLSDSDSDSDQDAHGIVIGNVKIDENPKLAHRFGITAMPTLLFFADGGMYVYEPHWPRLVDDFVTFVTGGYRESGTKKNVPTHEGVLKVIEDMRRAVYEYKLLKDLLTDFEEIVMLRKNAAVLLFLSGVVFGLLFGSILGLTRRRTTVVVHHRPPDGACDEQEGKPKKA